MAANFPGVSRSSDRSQKLLVTEAANPCSEKHQAKHVDHTQKSHGSSPAATGGRHGERPGYIWECSGAAVRRDQTAAALGLMESTSLPQHTG